MSKVVLLEDQVFRNGRLIGVMHRCRWHKYQVTTLDSGTVERTLTPLEPLLGADQSRDLEDCIKARPPVKPRDPMQERLEWIDRNFPRKTVRR